ncbi:DUF4136 domain-containing protein [Pseudohaliea rubra]|uniref:Putative lipoprotein n=1 Tax=Pseudohaliea rubra DSM 19751 TaxID=1265313 RepID=A0A095VV52_9GAMM|nr:DUF4136 domain-containing protein [Pseudohaliea rubra]KGE05230.1 putative lipoprotein [Pseudohaliea rubra DSM 19751]
MSDSTRSASRRTNALLALFCTALLAACASGPPEPMVDFNPGYDFNTVDTIAWYRDSGHVSGENPLSLSDMTIDRVDLALRRALEAKGITVVDDPAKADLLLSWHLATEEKTDVRTYETPVYSGMYGAGWGPYNRYALYSCWSCMPTRTQTTVRHYTLGTFVVDMIDPGMKKSVWRSVTSSRLKGEPQRDQDKYDTAAARILAAFPPLQGLSTAD